MPPTALLRQSYTPILTLVCLLPPSSDSPTDPFPHLFASILWHSTALLLQHCFFSCHHSLTDLHSYSRTVFFSPTAFLQHSPTPLLSHCLFSPITIRRHSPALLSHCFPLINIPRHSPTPLFPLWFASTIILWCNSTLLLPNRGPSYSHPPTQHNIGTLGAGNYQ